ncbi:MAG: GbsR/MarR family transcriptional regulator [Deltaproteobacteria bacterium]
MEKEKNTTTVPSEVHVLADQIGDFIQYWGFRKVEGRIWTYLFLAETPLNAEQLMDRTGISKAMLSLSLAELLKYDVIRKAFPDKERHQAYLINPNVMEVIGNVLRTRERQLLGKIESSFVLAAKSSSSENSPSINHERLEFLGQMIKAATQLLDSLLSMQALDLIPFQLVQIAPTLLSTNTKKKSAFDDKVGKV